MAKTPFLGNAYQARSKSLADQQLINMYLESAEVTPGSASAPAAFFACPGLVLGVTLGTSPTRACLTSGTSMYWIAGNTAYQLDSSLNVTTLGTIGTSSGAAYIVANTTQVGFFDSSGLWVWNGVAFAAATLPYGGTVGMPTYQDTFVLLNQPGTFTIWQSNSNDMLTWDPLNFTTEDGNAEYVVGLAAYNDQVIVFKQFSTCFYVNQGSAGFAYGRLQGVYPLIGCVGPQTISVVNNRVLWLGKTENGGGKVYLLDGYQPVEVSTYAIESQIGSYTTYQDAQAFSYSQQGHIFYVINFPSGNATWAYDIKESQLVRVPVWHQRGAFSAGQLNIYAGTCACALNGVLYMGDYASGKVYVLSLTNYQDNGQPRKILRTWRALPESSYQPHKVNYLDIKCETGVAVPPDTNPLVVLRQSFDGGLTWSSESYASMVGQTGQTNFDLKFNRLGATRRGLNSDRIFELSSTDDFGPVFIGAEIG